MNNTLTKSKRLISIDILRTIAIICMVICHFTVYLSQNPDYLSWHYFLANHMLGDFAAPFFLFLVGLSYLLSSINYVNKNHIKKTILRSITIFILGLVTSFVLKTKNFIFEWDILCFIGITLILLLVLQKLTSKKLLLICVLVFLVTPFLRGYTNYLAFWGGRFLYTFPSSIKIFTTILVDPVREYLPSWNFWEIFQGCFLVGFFPIFPWIIFPIMGLVFGRLIIENKFASYYFLFQVEGAGFCIVGFLLAFISSFNHKVSYSSHVTVFSFYPLSSSMLLLQLGTIFILFSYLWSKYDGPAYK